MEEPRWGAQRSLSGCSVMALPAHLCIQQDHEAAPLGLKSGHVGTGPLTGTRPQPLLSAKHQGKEEDDSGEKTAV